MNTELGLLFIAGVGVFELASAMDRFNRRNDLYRQAVARAVAERRPLLVVGDPDAGLHTKIIRAYGCGDLCLDLLGCPRCPVSVAADLTKSSALLIPDNSAVIFCSCVLEYVSDPHMAWQECLRIAGTSENIFLVTIDPGTAASVIFPTGTKWNLQRNGSQIDVRPITTMDKVVYASLLGCAVGLSVA